MKDSSKVPPQFVYISPYEEVQAQAEETLRRIRQFQGSLQFFPSECDFDEVMAVFDDKARIEVGLIYRTRKEGAVGWAEEQRVQRKLVQERPSDSKRISEEEAVDPRRRAFERAPVIGTMMFVVLAAVAVAGFVVWWISR